jgi:hypothetical protein
MLFPRGRPEAPHLMREGSVGGVLELTTSTTYEASWQIPGDNGVPIDYYLLSYFMVRQQHYENIEILA